MTGNVNVPAEQTEKDKNPEKAQKKTEKPKKLQKPKKKKEKPKTVRQQIAKIKNEEKNEKKEEFQQRMLALKRDAQEYNWKKKKAVFCTPLKSKFRS